jgi:hypothetical protein
MKLKGIFERAVTPALTILIAALGMVTSLSLSSRQGKVEAFACGQQCHNFQTCISGGGPCSFCDVTNHCNC